MRVAQARFRNHKFPAVFTDIFESFINELFLQAIDGFINASDSFQGEAGAAAVFPQPTNISSALFSNQHQTAAATPNAHDAAGLDHLIQPLMQNLRTGMWLRLMQARPCTYQSFETHDRSQRQIATCLLESLQDSLFVFFSRLL